MVKNNFKYFIVFLITTVIASDLNTVKSLAEAISRHETLKNGIWSIYAVEAESGEILLDINSHISLVPASNLKLITSAAALDILGAGMQLYTCLEYDGRIAASGKLHGNLYLRGGGDPTLGSPEMPGVLPLDSLFDLWTEAVCNAGIKEITGDIIADVSYFDDRYLPDDWSWGDMGNYYGAVTSSICINENSYNLFFRSPAKKFLAAEVLYTDPDMPGMTFKNFMLTGNVHNGSQAFIFGAPEQNERFLHGYIPGGRSKFQIEGSMPDPTQFVIQRLANDLRDRGIAIGGQLLKRRCQASTPRVNLLTITSPSLDQIIFRLNKKSNNLYAEQLLKILGKCQRGEGSLTNGIAVIEAWLSGLEIPSDGFFMQDGSGLARSNGCTTLILSTVLQKMLTSAVSGVYFSSLPVAGDADDQGNLKSFCAGTSAAGKVHVKSGLLNRVRSHSGYCYTKSGKIICFSMIANNFTDSYRTIDRLHETILVRMAELP
jgi:D-alanyl-D-alanine carboxypeptidase/D-alanyl-D-alanine-endopeptidase (penicillin-binding protein 4)